jgi:hypothetical protein
MRRIFVARKLIQSAYRGIARRGRYIFTIIPRTIKPTRNRRLMDKPGLTRATRC